MADCCYGDSVLQCSDFGDASDALKGGVLIPEKLKEIGDLIQDSRIIRKPTDITIADSKGILAQDFMIAGAF